MTTIYTAWLTADREYAPTGRCDVVVMADRQADDAEGEEAGPAVIGGPLALSAPVTATAPVAQAEAVAVLADAGWRVTGEWTDTGTGYSAPVAHV